MLAQRFARFSEPPVRYAATDPEVNRALSLWLRAVMAHTGVGGTHTPHDPSLSSLHHAALLNPHHAPMLQELMSALHEGDPTAFGAYGDYAQEHGLFPQSAHHTLGGLSETLQALMRNPGGRNQTMLNLFTPGTQQYRSMSMTHGGRFLENTDEGHQRPIQLTNTLGSLPLGERGGYSRSPQGRGLELMGDIFTRGEEGFPLHHLLGLHDLLMGQAHQREPGSPSHRSLIGGLAHLYPYIHSHLNMANLLGGFNQQGL